MSNTLKNVLSTVTEINDPNKFFLPHSYSISPVCVTATKVCQGKTRMMRLLGDE